MRTLALMSFVVAGIAACGVEQTGTPVSEAGDDSGMTRPIPDDEPDAAASEGDTSSDSSSDPDVDSSSANGDDVSADTNSGELLDSDESPADAAEPGDIGGDGGELTDTVTTDTDPGRDTDSVADVNLDRDAGLCASASASAAPATLPVDIIWVVDGSPSMDDSIEQVEANLNAFAARIAVSDLSYRVVMIGADRDYCADAQCFNEICVPPPLSAVAGCPDTDSPTYLHVREGVHSSDPFDKAMELYPEYQGFLRPGAVTHYVFVTDDDAGFGPGAEEFLAFLDTATSPGFSRVQVHSIVDLVDSTLGCGFDDTCSCGAERGDEYIAVSEATSGTIHSVCTDSWEPIFDVLEERVVEGTTLPCSFSLPDVGEELLVDRVNVLLFDESDTETLVPAVDGEAACDGAAGWYYDNPAAPTAVSLCPASCVGLAGRVEIEFGCATVKN